MGLKLGAGFGVTVRASVWARAQARLKVQGTFIWLVSRKPKVTDWSRTAPSAFMSLGLAGLSWLLPGEGAGEGGGEGEGLRESES